MAQGESLEIFYVGSRTLPQASRLVARRQVLNYAGVHYLKIPLSIQTTGR
jgi:hypothetical protein